MDQEGDVRMHVLTLRSADEEPPYLIQPDLALSTPAATTHTHTTNSIPNTDVVDAADDDVAGGSGGSASGVGTSGGSGSTNRRKLSITGTKVIASAVCHSPHPTPPQRLLLLLLL